jgi:phospholipid N-methyltransferase
MQDLGLALRRFIANPRRFGAVAPSSRALAERITENIDPKRGPVIELGPGTGVFTRALLDRQVAEKDLILVESDPHLAEKLSERFPAAHVVCHDAETLTEASLMSGQKVASVISGLPLRNFSKQKVASILQSLFGVMTGTGDFYQFTYANSCPVDDDVLDRLDLEARNLGRIWRNFPPATVYRFRRRDRLTALAA